MTLPSTYATPELATLELPNANGLLDGATTLEAVESEELSMDAPSLWLAEVEEAALESEKEALESEGEKRTSLK